MDAPLALPLQYRIPGSDIIPAHPHRLPDISLLSDHDRHPVAYNPASLLWHWNRHHLLCIPDRKNSFCHSALHRQSCRILPSNRERTSHASKKRAPCIKQVMNAVALLRSVIIDDMSTPIRFIKIQGDRIPLQGFPVSFYMLLFHLFTIF